MSRLSATLTIDSSLGREARWRLPQLKPLRVAAQERKIREIAERVRIHPGDLRLRVMIDLQSFIGAQGSDQHDGRG
jgi:hypothetical protein